MTGIIDYGMGNVGSLTNMVERLGEPAILINSYSLISSVDRLILPGVGSFDNGVLNLKEKGLWDHLNTAVLEMNKPILCICLGMQLITNGSEEGKLEGLKWIDAECKKFSFSDTSLKIPHMGWNTVRFIKGSEINDFPSEETRFYFVHSYYVDCRVKENILGLTEYGIEFASMVNKNKIYGTQCHPEKSHKYGMELLKKYLSVC